MRMARRSKKNTVDGQYRNESGQQNGRDSTLNTVDEWFLLTFFAHLHAIINGTGMTGLADG